MKPLSQRPIVTIIICTYARPRLLRMAVESLLRQTYPRLEIILINSGNPPESETAQYIRSLQSQDGRVLVIDYAENQYSPDDPQKMLDCMNQAMHEVATGELVLPMDDDNFLAADYMEKMVRLFLENPECTTAAGLPVNVDENGRLLGGAMDRALARNNRSRYMQGHLVVMDFYLNDRSTLWESSVCIFTIRRDEYIKAGGIQRGEHYASFYGVVPFGITGFDKTAILYNCVHGEQLHKKQMLLGNIGEHEVMTALRNMQVEERWRQAFGEEVARRVVDAVKDRSYAKMKVHAGRLYREGRLSAALEQYRRCLIVKSESLDALRKMGDIYVIKGQLQEARDSYMQALEWSSDKAELHGQLALVDYREGLLSQAAEGFQRAIQCEPMRSCYHMRLGWVLLRQGKILAGVRRWRYGAIAKLDGWARSMLIGPSWFRKTVYGGGVLIGSLGRLRNAVCDLLAWSWKSNN